MQTVTLTVFEVWVDAVMDVVQHLFSRPDAVQSLLGPMHTLWSIDSQKNWCHRKSDFKAKMYQIRFPLGLRPRPRWGRLKRSPRRALAVFKGLLLRGGRGKGRGREGEEKGKGV